MRAPLALFILLAACGGTPAAGEVAAPIVEVKAAEVGPDGPATLTVPDIGAPSTDAAVIAKGEEVFAGKGCSGCHAFGSKLVGPDLTGITDRRTVVWVQKMIQHPEAMTKEDPVAKALFRSAMVQMPSQGVTDEDMPALVAFLNSKK